MKLNLNPKYPSYFYDFLHLDPEMPPYDLYDKEVYPSWEWRDKQGIFTLDTEYTDGLYFVVVYPASNTHDMGSPEMIEFTNLFGKFPENSQDWTEYNNRKQIKAVEILKQQAKDYLSNQL